MATTTNNINTLKGIRDSSTDRTIVAICNAAIDALETSGGSPTFDNITVSTLATILTAAITTANITTANTTTENVTTLNATTANNTKTVAGVGAVNTPSYTFTGDLNTGIYWIAANHFALVANGVVVMDITQINIDLNLTSMSMPLLATNTINEKTANAGVTVEGVKVENGAITNPAETLIVPFYPQGSPQEIQQGTITLTNYQTRYTSGGVQDFLDIPDATQIGHMKEINYIAESAGADYGELSSITGYTSIVFNAIGNLIILMWNGTAWKIMKNIGCTVTP